MSTFSEELAAEVHSTVTSLWASRDGSAVPSTETLKLSNDRVELEAVLLYADLADSTELAITHQEIASEIFKSYLRGVTKIIKANDGVVRSFDGDRVMGVFIGDYKNTHATKCGLEINWFFRHVITQKFTSNYANLGEFKFDQTVGIDRSSVYVVRAGVRNDNDLIWVGRAPNIAAKLSSIRDGKHDTFITTDVYKKLNDEAKLGGVPKKNMWTLLNWKPGAQYGVAQIYGSNWTMEP